MGILYSQVFVLEQAIEILKKKYGPLDPLSSLGLLNKEAKEAEEEATRWDFQFTNHYEKEMGPSLFRKFISFEKLIYPDQISQIKIETNQLEEEIAKKHSPPTRPINLDPGYLDLAKVVLATTKDYSHRIYLSKGIYAEVTFSYEKRAFKFYEWTYPDYKSPKYQEFFFSLREKFHRQLREN